MSDRRLLLFDIDGTLVRAGGAGSRALAGVMYARYGVTAHTLLPGWIETAMTEGSFNNPKFVAHVMTRVPMRRWGQPEDFAGLQGQVNAVQDAQIAFAGGKRHFEVFDIEEGHCWRAFGFRTSRNWSPTRLIETMVKSSARPG